MALTREQQELLVRVGPGTPMGRLFRRYWVPILLATELEENDGPPVPVRILGEDLIAFRDTEGRLGLLNRFCAHRGVSLFFGRNEECGLRCPYHGWKYNTDGQCVDTPSEPEESNFAAKVRLKSYPCIEVGDIIMAYLGPPELQPPIPEFEWLTVPASHRYVDKRITDCNYLQTLEGGLDTTHATFLHRYEQDTDAMTKGSVVATWMRDFPRVRFDCQDAPWGTTTGAVRDVGVGEYWRFQPYIAPWYTVVAPFDERPIPVHAFVPIDDETTWSINWYYSPTREISDQTREHYRNGAGVQARNIPGTYIPAANKSNNYFLDRKAQKERRSYSGVPGIAEADAAVQESMGPIQDRTQERLGVGDTAIIQTRRLLARLAAAEQDRPQSFLPGLLPSDQRVRAASILAAKGEDAAAKGREAMEVHPGRPLVCATSPS